jgi:hypothetical protein
MAVMTYRKGRFFEVSGGEKAPDSEEKPEVSKPRRGRPPKPKEDTPDGNEG